MSIFEWLVNAIVGFDAKKMKSNYEIAASHLERERKDNAVLSLKLNNAQKDIAKWQESFMKLDHSAKKELDLKSSIIAGQQNKVSDLERKLSELSDTTNVLRSYNKGLKEELDAAKEEVAQLTHADKENIQTLNSELESLKSDYTKLSKEKSERINELEDALENMTNSLKGKEDSLNKCESTIISLSEEIEKLQANIKCLSDERDKFIKEKNALAEDNEAIRISLNESLEEYEQLNEKYLSAKNEIETYTEKFKQLSSNEVTSEELDALEQLNQQLVQDNDKLVTENNILSADIKNKEKEITKLSVDNTNLRKELIEAREHINQLQQKLEELNNNKEQDSFIIPLQNKESSLWGFSCRGIWVIQPIFIEEPVSLENGLFLVRIESAVGLVDEKANVIMDWENGFQCDELRLDYSDKDELRIFFKLDNCWGVTNTNGDILIKNAYQDIKAWNRIAYRVKANDRWGICRINNCLLVECIYNYIGEIDGNLAPASKTLPNSDIALDGFLDVNGNEYEERKHLVGSYWLFTSFERKGIKKEDGTLVISNTFHDISPWNKEKVKVKIGAYWGLINVQTKEMILDAVYNYIGNLVNNHRAKIIRAGVEFYINENGVIVAEDKEIMMNGWIKTQIGGKWGVEDKHGNEIVPHSYKQIASFRQKLVGISYNNGFIKLDKRTDYPIPIKGIYKGKDNNKILIDICGYDCYMPKNELYKHGSPLVVKGGELSNVIIGNLNYKNCLQKVYLYISTEKGLKKKRNHCDMESDFEEGVLARGFISKFKKSKKSKNKTRALVFLESMAGNTWVCKRDFEDSGRDISQYSEGDSILLKKIGYYKDDDITKWQIL